MIEDYLQPKVGCSLYNYLYKQLSILLLFTGGFISLYGQSFNINGPAGSGSFGSAVLVLANGNYVLCDPLYDEGAVTDVGAVYLYNGATHTLISTLKGSTAGDNVGSSITALSNGNFLLRSTNWDNGTLVNAGAITLVNGITGLSGVVSSANSLVGGTSNDRVGSAGIFTLPNGNVVVTSTSWHNGAVIIAGAATFIDAVTGLSGVVSSSNSLVGSHPGDAVGSAGIRILSNGNYVVLSPNWYNGAASAAGAATWGSGTTGVSGVVSSSNSLIGNGSGENVGLQVSALTNGNYVLATPFWDNGALVNAGAVTWGNGATGISGTISSANSLVGITAGDFVGRGIITLTNGNYVVCSGTWSDGVTANLGAATWCDGSTGRTGTISSSNSLVGSVANDLVGISAKALANGNYVVLSPNFDDGAVVNAGAVTWGNGTTGISGVVSSSNSLVGGSAQDQAGLPAVEALPGGNYVVRTSGWDNGAATDAGAITWCDGATGRAGTISTANSLVGSNSNDQLGSGTFVLLANGNYVIACSACDNGSVVDAGAVLWGSGTSAVTGVLSSSNALVGTQTSDLVSGTGITALSNGNYVVRSASWDNGVVSNAGAATWCNGSTGSTGVVSSTNSLVGGTASDNISSGGITALGSGNYVVNSPLWDNGVLADAGAATWADGTTGISGLVGISNSFTGAFAGDSIANAATVVLTNGNYVLRSSLADNSTASNVGAATWGSGSSGIKGVISTSNSLMGITASDKVSLGGIIVLSNGNYVVNSSQYDNGALVNAGALSFGNGSAGVTGLINTCNSVIGNAATFGGSLGNSYNAVYDYNIVSRPNENLVTIFNPNSMVLANHLDSVAVSLAGSTPVPLVANNGCRLIATLTASGASAIKDSVFSKVWIEPSVPVLAVLPFVARHYEITPQNNGTTATGRITLYYTQQEFDDFNAHPASFWDLPANAGDAQGKSHLRVSCYSGTSSDRSGLPGSYIPGAVVIDPNDADIVWNSNFSRWEISFNATGFGGFFLQTAVFPLAVTLQLNGVLSNQDALLNWKTGEETGITRFILERSTDGRNYQPVYQSAAFNNSGNHQYHYTDRDAALLQVSTLYYRVRQENAGGSFGYSAVIALSPSGNNRVLLYPNPVEYSCTLMVSVQKAQQAHYRILDNVGRVLQEKNVYLQAGTNNIFLKTDNLPAGVYQVCISGSMLNEWISLARR